MKQSLGTVKFCSKYYAEVKRDWLQTRSKAYYALLSPYYAGGKGGGGKAYYTLGKVYYAIGKA